MKTLADDLREGGYDGNFYAIRQQGKIVGAYDIHDKLTNTALSIVVMTCEYGLDGVHTRLSSTTLLAALSDERAPEGLVAKIKKIRSEKMGEEKLQGDRQ